jgi:aminopeptidase N
MSRAWIAPVAAVVLIGGGLLALKDQGATIGGLSKRTAGTGAPLTPEQQSVDFKKADLSFEVFPNRKSLNGRAVLDFAVRKPITKLQFDLDENLPIRSIAADGVKLDGKQWRNDDGMVTVNLPQPKNAGEALQLTVDYGGRPHVAERAPWDGGFVWAKTKDGKPWIATAVQGEGCDLFWPCFDNSLVEIGEVDLHITVPKGLVAPANGKLVGVREHDDGRRTYDWRTLKPNNYAISLNIAPYKQLTQQHRSRFGNTMEISYWYLPGEEEQAKALFAEFAPTVDFFERAIGPYPFAGEKLGVVETPHLGMEHQTINAYGNAYKPAAEGYDWLFNHEFSHEWFGNQLTNRDWDDMWLHEGLGSFMQPLYLRAMRGEMVSDAWWFKARQSLLNKHPVVSGTSRLEEEVYEAKTGPGGDIYTKGAWIARSLRWLMGDEPFFRATRRLVYGRPDPAPGNFQPRFGSTNEYLALSSQEAGRDLRWFFNAYLRHAQLPRLVEYRQGNRLNLQWQTPKGIPFPMPLDVEVDGQVVRVPMDKGRGSLTLPSADSLVTVDPHNQVLRQDDAIDRYRDWQAEKAKKS